MKVEGLLNQYQAAVGVNATRTKPKGEVAQVPQKESGPQAVPEKVEQAVRQLNDYLQSVQRNLQFSVDKDTKQVVVRVIDAESGEVVRQIPPESALELARNMAKMMPDQGLLFAQQA